MARPVVVLGSTGSIGTQTLDVMTGRPYRCVALAAGGGRVELLVEQIRQHRPVFVAVANADKRADVEAALSATGVAQQLAAEGIELTVAGGEDAVAHAATLAGADGVVVNGINGAIGLDSTLAALTSGATVALANKESMIAGGGLVARTMQRPGQIVPVDSEHSAIAQALRSGRHRKGLTVTEVDGTTEVARIILTASGGPFRGKKREELREVTPAQALNHPTWQMGPVVTINSATLMNKGLELIEAAYLFDMPPEQILPVVHPQSAVHSMVEFQDGSTIAQVSPPDMRLPIALGLSWPERLETVTAPYDWASAMEWTFQPVDHEAFPALRLARQAVETSELHPIVLNAANEICVEGFQRGLVPFLGIADTVAEALEAFSSSGVSAGAIVENRDHAREIDSWARDFTRRHIATELE